MELTEARQSGVDLAAPGGIERIRLEDGLGRVLAEGLTARHDVPRESRSRLDGFAMMSSDTSRTSPRGRVALRILPELLAAGHGSDLEILPGECARILTGAPVPRGADAVAPQEKTVREGDRLFLDYPLAAGDGVTVPGEEIRRGDEVVFRGEVLTPTRLALIAALGYAGIPVYRKPRVALLATGDEVREPGQPLEGPWTFCNNRLLLGWLVQQQGGDPVHLGVEPDDAGAIAGRLEHVDADVVITTGGIGRGDKDMILDAWQRLGVTVIFRHIRLSPGKNTALGVRGKQIFWAFPGNPWAGQLLFQELVAPVLWRFQGLEKRHAISITARLESSLKKTRGLCKVVRGQLDVHSIPAAFVPAGGKSGPLGPVLKTSPGYVVLESSVAEVERGSTIEVRLVDFPLVAFLLFGRWEA
jgi:molybdenum cofactor synthesis domain-containing protein